MVFYGNANDETHSREKRLFESMMNTGDTAYVLVRNCFLQEMVQLYSQNLIQPNII
jgi:hypothetical protein